MYQLIYNDNDLKALIVQCPVTLVLLSEVVKKGGNLIPANLANEVARWIGQTLPFPDSSTETPRGVLLSTDMAAPLTANTIYGLVDEYVERLRSNTTVNTVCSEEQLKELIGYVSEVKEIYRDF